jgi:mannan endo-1,4-beta-mannosidase
MKKNYRHGLMEMKHLFKFHVNTFFLFTWGKKKLSFLILFFIFCIAIGAKVSALDPANPNANSDVKLILNFYASLTNQTDHRLISGQFIGYSGGINNYGMITGIYNNTGKWMGIVGSDYVDWSNSQQIKYNLTNPELIKAWKAGSLVAIQVHMTNPANPNGGGLRDTGVDLNDLLVSGTDTYSRWFAEMDTIAAGLSQLQDSGVVVLFRPFHEMNGSWFWWGGKNHSLFEEVWKQMFDYFTNTKKLNNLLWVYGPNMGSNAANYYPGDAYVDITGLDAYTSTITTAGISGYPSMVNLGKPFGFNEYGPENASNPSGNFDYRILINGLKTNFPKACFFMCWNDNWGMASNKYVKEALSDNYVANRDNLTWNQLPTLIRSENYESFKDIMVYPNPLEKGSSLMLELKGFTDGEEIKVSVFDPAGKEITKQKFCDSYDGTYEVKNARGLQQGIYLVFVESQTKSATIQFAVK